MARASSWHKKGGPRPCPSGIGLAMPFALCLVLSQPATVAAAPDNSSGDGSATTKGAWTVYHHDPEGGGDVVGPSFARAARAWTSPALDGDTFGEPLEATGRVIVATEDDSLYALSARTGRVLWRTHLATPVPAATLPCGDITPTVGITGTPVVNVNRGEIYVVADEEVAGLPRHELVGLNLFSGKVELHQDADPPGADPAALLQRTGLALDKGEVVFGFGGNDGDCSTYHGWVEAVPVGGGTPRYFEVDRAQGDDQGAIWMGGAAPEVDRAGDIWVAAGNGSVDQASAPYDDSDSVLELSPRLSLVGYFAPATWASDNDHDRDLGSSPPALVGGSVVQAGKSQTAFLLDRTHLGGVGGQESDRGLCAGGDVDGGVAVAGSVAYLPCQRGLLAVRVATSPPALAVLWQSTSGASEPPIVAGGLVWSMGGPTLYGLEPLSGNTVVQLSVGQPANHFPTPSVADGLLLAPSADAVVAFDDSAGLPAPPTRAPPTSRS